jgi:hypothetical protein
LLAHPDHALDCERGINFDGQALAHAFNSGRHTRLAEEEPLLRPSREIQSELAIDPPQPLVIPGMPIEPQSIATLPVALATLGRHERR